MPGDGLRRRDRCRDVGTAEINELVRIIRAYLAEPSLSKADRVLVRPRDILVQIASPPLHEFRLPSIGPHVDAWPIPGVGVEHYFCVIYGFRWRGVWLKVGRATIWSRLAHDHYNPWRPSSLAASLMRYAELVGQENPRLPGLRQELLSWGPSRVGQWVEKCTTKYHIFLPLTLKVRLSDLERLAHVVLKPAFESERIAPASRIWNLSRGRSCFVRAVQRVINRLSASDSPPDPALIRHLRACLGLIDAS